MVLVPHASAAWQHAFDNVTPNATLSFASTGIGFGITGVPLAENSALVEAGLDLNLKAPPQRLALPIQASSPTTSPTTP